VEEDERIISINSNMTTPLRYLLFIGILTVLSCNQSKKHTADTTSAKQISTANHLFFHDSGYSSITLQHDTVDGYPEIEEILRTQSYHFITYQQYFSGSSGPWHALISELSEQHSKDAPEDKPVDGKIILSAFIPSSNPIQTDSDLRANRWQDTVNANEAHYKEEFIEFISPRNNNNYFEYPSFHSIYSYDDGKKIMTFSSDFYGIESTIDSSKRRYIGYLDHPSNCDSPEDSLSDADGVLSYIDPIAHHAQHLIVTYSNIDEDTRQYEAFETMTISGLQAKSKVDHGSGHTDSSLTAEHWGYSDLKNFIILLKFTGDYQETLSIPVINDSIDISHVHSSQFELQVSR
jgi:hypothetical protein